MPRPGEGDEPADPAGKETWPPTLYVPAPEPTGTGLARRIEAAVRDYPDFPRRGVRFRDVVPVFRDPELFDDILTRLAGEAGRRRADWVAAVESRGFLLGAPLADRLGLPFAPIRKRGKLPGETVSRRYELEYDSAELELQLEAIAEGSAVLLVDDLLATGGTLRAAAGLVEQLGARVAGMAVLVELEALDGRESLKDYNLLSLISL